MNALKIEIPASVVIIGCPIEPDLPEFTHRLVLVEPDSARAAVLGQSFADRPNISVIPVAVGAISGQAHLYHFNIDGLRSLRPPRNRLGTLVRGLSCRKHGPVDVLALETLVENLGELPRPLHVHVNLLGLEEEILDNWPAPLPDSIRLQCSRVRVLKGQADLSSIVRRAREQLFDLVELDDDSPDWLEIKLERNKDQLAHSQAVERLSKVEEELAIQVHDRKRAEEEKALALKAETMLKSDLQTLRKRYKALQLERQSLTVLLQKLVSLLRDSEAEVEEKPKASKAVPSTKKQASTRTEKAPKRQKENGS